MEHTCAFTGHRYICRIPKTKGQYLRNAVKESILDLYINYGVRTFLSGMALGADQLCAEAVIDMRRTFPDIKLCCVLPCLNQSEPWTDTEKHRYSRIIRCANNVICLSEKYHEDCMQDRNKYLVTHADILLAIYDGNRGGTEHTYRCAKHFKKPIIRINPKNFITDRSDFFDVLFRS